ncbi:hypothetical protein PENSPDRAFT_680280 [Peniophora sp. CONT]|nr:hypothetical protein PENSPDRAFT_680280 [Peniophora sp. CONT]
MTRTERAVHPRALAKDASVSRNGFNSNMRKGGAGAHNWGTVDDEARYEYEADVFDNEGAATEEKDADASRPALPRSISEEERTKAIATRKRALSKGADIDLSEIARTSSAVSSSPPSHLFLPPPQ